MVNFITLFQSAQNRDRVSHVRFGDQYRLKATLKSGILLDVEPVFVEGRSPNTVEFPPSQHRLEQIPGIHCPLCLAGTCHCVKLVDEEHDFSLRVLNFFEHRLEPLLELASILGSGDKRSHIERHNSLVLETLRDIAANHTLSQTFNNGGLSDSRFSNQNRVVLGAPGKNLHDASNLFIPTDYGVELPVTRCYRQIAAILFERLIGGFRVRRNDSLTTADLAQSLQQQRAFQASFR